MRTRSFLGIKSTIETVENYSKIAGKIPKIDIQNQTKYGSFLDFVTNPCSSDVRMTSYMNVSENLRNRLKRTSA